MLNYRVQTCIDGSTYKALEEFMKEENIENTSMALRRILLNYFGDNSEEANKL